MNLFASFPFVSSHISLFSVLSFFFFSLEKENKQGGKVFRDEVLYLGMEIISPVLTEQCFLYMSYQPINRRPRHDHT